ncbi:MAG: glycosyltransferase [Bacteroidota bacterium]
MAKTIKTTARSLNDYGRVAGDHTIEEIRALAAPFRGAEVLHINSTAYGGGVSEILYTLVPLMKDVGLAATWTVIEAPPAFFDFTKALHNALQGMAGQDLTTGLDGYLATNEHEAAHFSGTPDFVVVHDPQPAPLASHLRERFGSKTKWIWRCHIDLSSPAEEAWDLVRPFVERYDAAIFTMSAYAKEGLRVPRLAMIPPSIDPLSPKNVGMPEGTAREIVAGYGVDPSRPLLVQVSRFDPWKDPLGVVDAYRMVKREMPGVQLALIGSMAADDPEGIAYYRMSAEHAAGDPDVHILSNLNGVGNADVNAFQTAADVVVQKSIREGFGLTVSEGLWKGKPVVAGDVGGIPLQVEEGKSGFLVKSVEECAEKILYLLSNPEKARQMGLAGKDHVRRHFLSTRHLADYLRLFSALAHDRVAGAGELAV